MKKLTKISIVLMMSMALLGCQKTSTFEILSNEDGTIKVTAENATEDSGGMGYITLEEEQLLMIDANFSENSSVEVKIMFEEPYEVEIEEQIIGDEDKVLELPVGNYAIDISANEGTTGSLIIGVE